MIINCLKKKLNETKERTATQQTCKASNADLSGEREPAWWGTHAKVTVRLNHISRLVASHAETSPQQHKKGRSKHSVHDGSSGHFLIIVCILNLGSSPTQVPLRVQEPESPYLLNYSTISKKINAITHIQCTQMQSMNKMT